ncbi:DUF3328 superfamily domain-containing protein [Histoplasma capsulatum var. duboisii H88]|uniref:DUF3328 superfamily domain-containing protein n=2 Tax=Ajellomyces capsulatus TaxID=5037 RepID=A0A8H7YCA0_AJECA|nr:DUF3328 superfamily domain-containing protein [Histoplasma capsulatum]QSS56320.1 DUF3328 superfamily domain-containing protein [Histoplasma capsulatum var. duboisii H88]QSS71181.1 DUF3328 superfamily domain-containing protein [Histoplasma capsulatum G186AR]
MDYTKQRSSTDDSLLPSSTESAETTDTLLEKSTSPYREKTLPFWREHVKIVIVTGTAFFFLFAFSAILFESNRKLEKQLQSSLVYSPANEALKWTVVEWVHDDGAQGDYVGEPRPVLEKAWRDIFDIMNVRLSKQDLVAVGRLKDAVALPDGSGYAGTLNVFHELHCIWWLYKYVHKDHYFEGATPHEQAIMKLHSHHCLNYLRKSAMCHSDVGIITYNWKQGSLKPKATATTHQCADWSRITQWSSSRSFNMTVPGYIVNPSLGPIIKEGQEEGLAVGIPEHDVDVDVDALS